MKRILLLLAAAVLAAACQKDPVTPAVTAESITLSPESLFLVQGDTKTLAYVILPVDAASLEVVWNSDNAAVASVDEKGLVTGVAVGVANISVMVKENPSVVASCKVQVGEKGVVDLGLSVLWASCNVGASSPEECGNYYSWGETEPKTMYDLDTYKFYVPGAGDYTKYNTLDAYGYVDGKTVLEPEDDAATVALGGKWRTPNKKDWNELYSAVFLEWTLTRRFIDDVRAVRGWEITNKNTGNTLFLPCAGYASMDTTQQVNEYAYYWSAELDPEMPICAFGVDLSQDAWYAWLRYQGFPVRAVCDKE